MIEFVSAFCENYEKTEAVVATLSQLVPGFGQAYEQQINYKHAKQSLIADQLIQTVRR
jgi:hypothetical protein